VRNISQRELASIIEAIWSCSAVRFNGCTCIGSGHATTDSLKLSAQQPMFDYMPGFKRLLDTSESDTMDELCRRFAGFFRYAKPLKCWQPAFNLVRLRSPSKRAGERSSRGDHTKQKNLCVKAFRKPSLTSAFSKLDADFMRVRGRVQ
jgi:hypothetical protein